MMIFTKLRLINRFSPPLVHLSRGYRLPPNFVSYLDNFSKDFNNQNNSIVNSFEELKGKLAEHAELETMKKNTTDNEFVEMAAADMEDISEDIEELVEKISFKLG
eukprot:GFUD01099836.1.p1 GENE.GFUD01099836.1~~GFUD01099836.1.p1  ORF type:complete len:105 (-),score=22.94 GFUD01099836.1:98-412(-)